MRLIVIAGNETVTLMFTRTDVEAESLISTAHDDDQEVAFDGEVSVSPSDAFASLEEIVFVRGDL